MLSVSDEVFAPGEFVSIIAIGQTSEHPHVAQAMALIGRLKMISEQMIVRAINVCVFEIVCRRNKIMLRLRLCQAELGCLLFF
jgi:hypothetical protein